MSSHDNSDLGEEELNKFSSGKFFYDQDDLIDNENEIDNENNADDENNPDNLDKEEGKDNKGKKNQENEPEKEQGNQELELDNQDLEEQEEDSSDSNNDKRFPDVEPNDWIHWFCKLRGNEFFTEIDENFIKNEENLVGIKYKKEHIKTILSERPKKFVELNRELIEELQEVRDIYGAIHKRFLFTPLGMGLLREKFLDCAFGTCPRILCNKQSLLPIGLSEDMRYSQVKVFCPLCQEVYKPRDKFYGFQGGKKIYKFDLPDGIYFGTSLAQEFLIRFPDLDPRLEDKGRYIPKLYGFRIFGKYGSKYYTNDQEELERRMIKFGIKKN
jgi:casein kinase II subunit beta